jgi:tetratricopeptide (TPR) repeat protein
LEREAEKADAAGDTDRALSLYATALAKAPEWTEGWWKYGSLLYEVQRFSDAAQVFGRLVRLAPENPLGFALLGLCEYEEHNWENATLHLQRALAASSGLPESIHQAAAYHLGLVFMRRGKGAAALATFKRLFYQAPRYPGLAIALGAAELNLQEIPEPDSPVAAAVNLAGQAAIATFEDRKNDADQAFRALTAEFPTQPFVHLNYGVLLESQHRDEEAAAAFLAETNINPSDATAWLWLGRIAVDREDAVEARADALRARALDPSDPVSYLIEGRCDMLEHQWQGALEPLREAEKRAPQSAEVHYALASVYSALNHKTEANQERQLFLETSKDEQPQ